MLEVRHQVRGRLRLRIPGLLNDRQLAVRLAASLGSVPGVSEVRVNPACGCLVVHYEPLLPAARIRGLIESALSPREPAPAVLLPASLSAPRLTGPLAPAAATGAAPASDRPARWRRWLPWRRRTAVPRPLGQTALVPLAAPLVTDEPARPARPLATRRGQARRPAAPPLAYRVQFEMVRRVLSNSLECLWYDFRFGSPRGLVMEPPSAPTVPIDLFDRLLARPLGLDGVAAAALGRTRR